MDIATEKIQSKVVLKNYKKKKKKEEKKVSSVEVPIIV